MAPYLLVFEEEGLFIWCGAGEPSESNGVRVLRSPDHELADGVRVTRSALSRACHHHPYELAPTVAELSHWITQVERLVSTLEQSSLQVGGVRRLSREGAMHTCQVAVSPGCSRRNLLAGAYPASASRLIAAIASRRDPDRYRSRAATNVG